MTSEAPTVKVVPAEIVNSVSPLKTCPTRQPTTVVHSPSIVRISREFMP